MKMGCNHGFYAPLCLNGWDVYIYPVCLDFSASLCLNESQYSLCLNGYDVTYISFLLHCV